MLLKPLYIKVVFLTGKKGNRSLVDRVRAKNVIIPLEPVVVYVVFPAGIS